MLQRIDHEFSRDLVPKTNRRTAYEGIDGRSAENKNNIRNRRAIDNIVTQLISFEFKMIDLNVERRLVTDLSEDSKYTFIWVTSDDCNFLNWNPNLGF